jgi:hypothetical protein
MRSLTESRGSSIAACGVPTWKEALSLLEVAETRRSAFLEPWFLNLSIAPWRFLWDVLHDVTNLFVDFNIVGI